MTSFFELFEYAFMRNALYAGVLAAVAFGIIGTYVVVRRIVFISGGIAHASFGGVGLALFLGFNPILGAALVALASAVGIGLLSRETLEREETTIGIIWAVGMALGAFFYRLTPGYLPDPASYLFGNILLLKRTDIYLLMVLTAVILLTAILFYNRLLATAFDEEFTRVMGIRTMLLYIYMLVLVALTVVLLIKFMGIVLVLAMFTIPTSIVGKFTCDLRKIMLFSVLLSLLFVLSGIWLAFELDYETGATIVIEAAVVYFAVLVLRGFYLRNGRQRKAVPH